MYDEPDWQKALKWLGILLAIGAGIAYYFIMGILFTVFWGTIFPILSELVTGQKITVGPPFYQKATGPQFLVLLILMGIGPLVAWRKASAQIKREGNSNGSNSMITALPQDNRRWTAIMAVTIALGATWTFVSRVPPVTTTDGAPPAVASPREGFSAPDFTLDLLGGGQITLSELRGKVVMVNLWASWCAPCRIEMPEIEQVYRAYKNLGFVVIGLNTTFQDSEPDAAAFVGELGLTFPVALDRNGAVSRDYQLRALPSTYFIDRNGVIRSAVFGAMNGALIQSKVEELIKESP